MSVYRLFLLKPTVVFAASVNEPAGVTYPLDEVRFDNVTAGSFGAIQPGMVVQFDSVASGVNGYDLGKQRIRKAATADTLYIGRSSQGQREGEADIINNTFITVLDLYQVASKIPHFDPDGTAYKDSDIAYTDQTLEPPPVANTGPATAGTIDPDDSVLVVDFDAGASFATAAGATITGYLWTVGDGTITVGTSASQAITVEFPAGFRYVSLTVTDGNGKTHTARCPVFARDPDDDECIQAFEIETHRITPQGQQLGVRVRQPISLSDYPDGTLALLWYDEPATPADRSHMQFTGWIQQEPVNQAAQRTALLQEVTLNCVDVAGRLALLPGFPQIVEIAETPETWAQMASPNMDRYLHYLLHWHSTALDLADWTWTGTGDDYPFRLLGSDGQSLFDQVQRRANALVPDYHLTCNRRGQLRTVADPMVQEVADRTTTVQTTVSLGDWSAVRYERTRPPRVHWLRSNAIVARSDIVSPIFCQAPGETPGQGEQELDHGEQLAMSQAGLNAVTGHRYARINAPQSKFSVTLADGDDRGIEPADMTWVRLIVGAAQRTPGQVFDRRGLVQEINIRYEHGRTGLVRTVEMQWERETVGTPAITVNPAEAEPAEPAPDDGEEFWGPPPPPFGSDLGFGTLYVMTDEVIVRTRDVSAASPTWTVIATTPAASEHMTHFALDPWAPGTVGYYASKQGLYRSTNLDQVVPTWTQIFSLAEAEAVSGRTATMLFSSKILCSINVEGHVAWVWDAHFQTELWFSVSTDRGANWTHVRITPTLQSRINAVNASGLVPHIVGGALHYYVADYGRNTVWKSTDSGSSFARLGDLEPTGFQVPGAYTICLHIPFHDNDDGQILYVGTNYRPAATERFGGIWRSYDGGATWTNITPVTDRGVIAAFTGVETSTNDRLLVYAWVEGVPGSVVDPPTLYVSTSGGDTWTLATGAFPSPGSNVSGSSGFPYAASRIYATTARNVLISTDAGATWVIKTGNLVSLFGGVEAWNGAHRRSVIVADWTE